ncbi:condensation domain-containing protein, partial [Streptomyces sp. UNOC14_S4]|uniref:condensation domain-containing protein n=1 Tax=Streptomyces sp. UNOC14_S4 TaxID=2872340 RepID=UPI001E2E6DCB
LHTHALLRVGGDHWLWYHRSHHSLLDTYGHTLVTRRVADVCTALAAGRAPAPTPFGPAVALAEEETAYRASARHLRDRVHWLAELADRPEPRTLAGRTAHPSRTSLRSEARLAPGTAEALRRLAASVRAGWREVVCAAQALHLARATGAGDVLLALPVMGRTGSVALRTPGSAENVVPLRLTVTSGTTFAELTHQAVLGIRAARRHQRFRHEDIRRAVTGPRVTFLPPGGGPSFGGARSDVRVLATGPVDDLTVLVQDGPRPRIDVAANPALYGADELAAHHGRFLDLLARLAHSDPHRRLGAPPRAHLQV